MPLSATRLIQYERLVTPREHLGVLIEPAAARLHTLLEEPLDERFAAIPLLGTTLGELRTQLRETLQLTGPVILSGHQAEFVHAGVFAKTMAAHALAARTGGQAVFLTVDSDVPKATQLAVPEATPGGLRRVDVTIPGCDPHQPFEFQPPTPRASWLQFFATLAALHRLRDQALLDTFARAWLTTDDPNPPYCDALTRAQSAAEAALDLPGVRELRMSHLCATAAFRAFVARMLLDAPRCASAYNAAQTAYRQRHRVRAAGRPVPPLHIGADAVELPLWVVRPDEPRRRLLTVQRGDVLELATDNRVLGHLRCADLARAGMHSEPWPLERDGWHIRPRALALSAFARYFLADLFIHGVGGAKYDEMMEDFATEFFGVEPGPACCVTATLYLPLPRSGLQPVDIATARHQSRDLRFNPQRHIRPAPAELLRERTELVRRAEDLRRHQPREHGDRRLVFREIRRINEQMLGSDPWRAAEYDQRIQTLEAQRKLDRIALDREYFYALHPRTALAELAAKIRAELATPV